MPSEEAIAFHYAVYEEVMKIPYGKVTTYGHIAKLIERPENPRQVGQSLKILSQSPSEEFNYTNVPWWRVINAQGRISPRAYGMITQEQKLEEEQVEVTNGKIDLTRCGWLPPTIFDD